MKERKGAVTFQGNPLTLVGEPLLLGAEAPDFQVHDGKMAALRLNAFKNRVRVIASVPSIDTPTCDAEAKRFNQAAAQLGQGVVIMTVSMDLPFALDRWCESSHSRDLYVFSDHRQAEFGKKYGVLIKELRLLSRAVFVVDAQDKLVHVEYVSELSEHPDYEAAFAAVKQALEQS